jgi:hypothetical protein
MIESPVEPPSPGRSFKDELSVWLEVYAAIRLCIMIRVGKVQLPEQVDYI